MKNVFLAILFFLLPFFFISGSETTSVMASGDWYKISVDRDGIYRITYSELVDLGITDPANVRIYGSGGAMLPETADKKSGNDLQEIPIWIHTKDGVFKNGDYILFYGQGPVVWQYNKEKQEFEHSLHLWDNLSYYFITSKAGGKKIVTETPPVAIVTQNVTAFDERQYYEKELANIVQGGSGRYWYGENFQHTSQNPASTVQATSHRFPFTIQDIETENHTWLHIAFMARTPSSQAQLQVNCNSQQVDIRSLPPITGNDAAKGIYFNTPAFNLSSNNLSVELTVIRNGISNAAGWLDYIRLFTRRKLNMAASQLFFRDTHSVGQGRTARFQITGCNSNTHVWDITDMHNIRRMDASLSGSTLSYSAATDTLREFVAFDIVSNLLKPVFPDKKSRTDNQNLHGIENVDMVIVTHPDFLDVSQELAALHRSRDGMAVEVVTAEQVYNEFSSGKQDPAAIRNFMKYLYEQPSTVQLKYLLLMGAGSYDNKSNMRTTGNTNFIVTYQSVNSWHTTNSFVSDDYFGILGDRETVFTGKLSIGVGRIPVQTDEQARDAIAKIRRYMDATRTGDWPRILGLLADGDEKNMWTADSEKLANYVNTQHPQYTVEKMYLDASPRKTTADGHRYPEVELQLNNLLNSGCLLVNYIGHGNASGLSAARVVNTTNIGHWRNKLYPLFVAATCEFGRYDNSLTVTAGETMMLTPNGGSIAVLTSTRLVFSGQNLEFNQNFFRELFTRSTDDHHRLGDILRRAKNKTLGLKEEDNVNRLCFTLLGNPALTLPVPKNYVHTLSINGKDVNEPLDTLKANSRVTVKGCITNKDGQVSTGFNGVLHLTLYDKERKSQTISYTGDATPITFYTQTSTLFKGKTVVENGEFELSFIMPRDINYQYGFGKISFYACADDGTPAAGSFKKLIVGGSVTGQDYTKGPNIRLFMNDTLFRDGGITDQNPRLIAFLQDETGINTSDEGLGHQITATLSHDPKKVYILNRHYEADLNAHNRGTVNYRFTNLPAGDYELLFTAWNLQNYSSQANIKFRVTQSTKLLIDKLYNYPNPFAGYTRIYFEFNMPDTELQVELQIFDMTGRILRSMKQSFYSEGFTSGEFEWDGCDANGGRLIPGIYPYRVILSTEKGQTVWQTSKMAIIQ